MGARELPLGEAPVLAFRGAPEFEAWLERQAARSAGVWLKLAKKGVGIPSLTDDEAVDVGLCFGWISGQRKSLDRTFYLQKYVPRRPRSRWSRVNVDKVEALLAQGRMRPSGLTEVEAARADGRWAAAYAPQRDASVPADLAVALAGSPQAARAFEGLGKTRRYAVILGLLTARTASGREKRLRKALTALEGRPPWPARGDAARVLDARDRRIAEREKWLAHTPTMQAPRLMGLRAAPRPSQAPAGRAGPADRTRMDNVNQAANRMELR